MSSANKRHGGKSKPVKKNGLSDFAGWIAFLDIFAFGSHLESNFFKNAEEKLLAMHKSLAADSIFCGDGRYFMFSDSIVVWHESLYGDDQTLRNFTDRIARAEKIAADQGYLLRGSVAYGRILLSSNYILGDAYLRAYRFEANQLIEPIVVIPECELSRAGVENLHEFDIDQLALKGGKTKSVIKLEYVPWEQIENIRNANIAAIMSSALSDEQKLKYAKFWSELLNGV